MIDIHSHILPGLDDGAKDIEQSLTLCRIAVQDGVKTMVATPHMVDGNHTYNPETVSLRFAELTSFLNRAKINLEILPGAEVHINPNLLDLIAQRKVLTLNDTGRYLLLELPFRIIPPHTKELIFNLRLKGITPVIAHPERISEVQQDPNKLYDLISVGALSQITAYSLLGKFGSTAKKCAIQLIEHNLTHIIASDTHSPDLRPPGLTEAVKVASKLVGKDVALRMVTTTPKKVIMGEPQEDLPEPKPIKSGFLRFFR
jgi:protein-tyrosine phosphatase